MVITEHLLSVNKADASNQSEKSLFLVMKIFAIYLNPFWDQIAFLFYTGVPNSMWEKMQ